MHKDEPAGDMIVLGLTGSVGMGKSTTAKLFADLGIPVFDADASVHALYSGDAVAPVEAAFPGVSRAGAIDRARLGERVVNDDAALQRLESIVHPLVRRDREAFLAKARAAGENLVVLDIPLLFETGAETEVDVVAVVTAPEPVQKARMMAREGMTPQRFEAILKKQMPDAEKRQRADFVIETGQGIERAAQQVRDIIATLEKR